MSSHIHMIIGRHGEQNLEGIIRDIKKFTAVQIIKPLRTINKKVEENCCYGCLPGQARITAT
jgi:hypothetical protein